MGRLSQTTREWTEILLRLLVSGNRLIKLFDKDIYYFRQEIIKTGAIGSSCHVLNFYSTSRLFSDASL